MCLDGTGKDSCHVYGWDIALVICEGCCPAVNVACAPNPGEACKPDKPDVLASQLNRPSLSLWLLVSIARWFATSRVRLVCVTGRKDYWKLTITGSVVPFSQEGAPVECHMFTPLFAPELITRSSDILCPYCDEDMPSFVVTSELFDRVSSQPGVPGVALSPVLLLTVIIYWTTLPKLTVSLRVSISIEWDLMASGRHVRNTSKEAVLNFMVICPSVDFFY